MAEQNHKHSHSRYSRGCRCDGCRAAHRTYERNQKRKRSRMAQGLDIYESQFVEAQEAQDHILFLIRSGIAIRHIAILSKSDKTTINRIKKGYRTKINKPLSQRILAVPAIIKSPGVRYGSEDVVAMVKELKQLGISQPMIAEAIGIPSKKLNLRRNIAQRRRDAITKFYQDTMNGLKA